MHFLTIFVTFLSLAGPLLAAPAGWRNPVAQSDQPLGDQPIVIGNPDTSNGNPGNPEAIALPQQPHPCMRKPGEAELVRPPRSRRQTPDNDVPFIVDPNLINPTPDTLKAPLDPFHGTIIPHGPKPLVPGPIARPL
ncbi:hypothetical protein M408DRAFT_321939 [Serendipita vermifera MAFF 305830]|uniref:Uncharacterized protein n=1 Tax=Serendipita vermifera MAFF 305830 TaxID=933852 RepID=A0A0C2XPP5_SERVB|nr:hypothetical protein M408DRAFT_321939 [Serendipita vermifera MAFF 305830]